MKTAEEYYKEVWDLPTGYNEHDNQEMIEFAEEYSQQQSKEIERLQEENKINNRMIVSLQQDTLKGLEKDQLLKEMAEALQIALKKSDYDWTPSELEFMEQTLSKYQELVK